MDDRPSKETRKTTANLVGILVLFIVVLAISTVLSWLNIV